VPAFVNSRRLATALAAALALGSPAPASQDDPSAAATQAEMKPYTETIPGTSVKFEMVPIKGGTFTLGSPDDEADRGEDEGPQRTIAIRPFWMQKTEVTWEQFDEYAFSLDIKRKERAGVDLAQQSPADRLADAVTRPTPPYADMTFGYGHDKYPAICMTHHAAMEYCRWLSARTGKLYRLPTEAEWEYAARAGTTTPYSFGDDPEKLGDYAWYVMNAEQPMPVGQKKPNPWGLYDMHGNVAEWVVDKYDAEAYAKLPAEGEVVEPAVLPTEDEYPYVVRGGSWDDDPEMLRSAARRASNREWSVQDPQRPQSVWWHTDAHWAGFRVVRPLEESENLVGVRSKVIEKKKR
jgi:formylglycine-generating enzyme required for sulfatase activity